jgi:hypothetical protein
MLARIGTFTACLNSRYCSSVDRFGKDHVGAGFDAGNRALDCRLQSFDGDRIGTRHDHESGIAARIHGGLDAVDHFFLRHDRLARPVATALGRNLVLDMQRTGAGFDQRAHRARDVERAAPAGVDVDQRRQIAGIGDAAYIGQHVFHRADAQIGHAQRIGRHAAAGQIQRTKSRALGHQRGVSRDRADDLQRRFGSERGAEARSG